MAITGFIRLFRGAPKSAVGPDGKMALGDHLRELRSRILKIAVVLVVGIFIAWFFYPQLFELILKPYRDAQEALLGEVETDVIFNGPAAGLLLRLKVSALAAVVLSSPFWLYQIWAFIVPGLHAHEKKWTRIFTAVAGPTFLLGVAIGYYVLPKGLEVLIGFVPEEVQSLVDFGDYFAFLVRMLLVFGIAFEIPVFVVLLNLAGVLPGKALGAHRPWIIVGVFVFAAVATPSTDPFSMLFLAIPMVVLFAVSEVICRVLDRRRKERNVLAQVDDDELSPLD